MKQERWKVTLAAIFLLASGFWYSHLYYDGKVIQETAPVWKQWKLQWMMRST